MACSERLPSCLQVGSHSESSSSTPLCPHVLPGQGLGLSQNLLSVPPRLHSFLSQLQTTTLMSQPRSHQAVENNFHHFHSSVIKALGLHFNGVS